jgi:hypothetical protein
MSSKYEFSIRIKDSSKCTCQCTLHEKGDLILTMGFDFRKMYMINNTRKINLLLLSHYEREWFCLSPLKQEKETEVDDLKDENRYEIISESKTTTV